jgi:hypothetical protein
MGAAAFAQGVLEMNHGRSDCSNHQHLAGTLEEKDSRQNLVANWEMGPVFPHTAFSPSETRAAFLLSIPTELQ